MANSTRLFNPVKAGLGSLILLASLLRVGMAQLWAADAAYFPLEAGRHWVYRTTNKQKHDVFDMNVSVEGPWKQGDLSGTILTQRDKRGQMRQFILVNEKGVFMSKLGLKKSISPEVDSNFTPPVPMLIFPLSAGTKVHWEGRLKVAWIDKPIIFDGEVLGEEAIEVPAGKFNCVKLHYHEKRGEETIDETVWYAEGVGQVKYDGGQYVKELKNFKGI